MADNLTMMEVERDLIAYRRIQAVKHPGMTYTEWKVRRARRC